MPVMIFTEIRNIFPSFINTHFFVLKKLTSKYVAKCNRDKL